MSLLMGKADESDANDSLDNSCCCILLSIDRFDMFSAHYSYREQYYYKSLVVKVCNQVIALYTKGAGAIMESDKIALVVSAGSDAGDSFHQMLQTICNRIIDELSVIHDFTISIGVGGIYDNKDSVRKSYLEASKALKYRLLFGYNCVITYAEICDFTNSFSYPIEEENHIMNNLRQNSSQEIFEAIEKIIGEFNLFKTKKINYEIVMHCVTKLVNKTLEYLASSYISVADIFGENYDVYYEFTGIETLSDLKQWLEFFYERIITYQQLYTHNADENKHYKDIVQFIQSSYMDSNLCIEAIADKLNLSYSHVRRIFKSFSGVNFVDYLNKIRIANAKEMLLKTDCTIKDIANQSGYNNDQCLTRFFKRYEGVTPGKYRANWQDDIAKPNHRMS
jgi:AraC-type DNA-binding domain-containing proteins